MGIKNLNKFLKNKCPEIFSTIHLSNFAYKKIVIDVSLYLHKYKAVCGENWLSAFVNLIISLRRNNIHICFIFDGQAIPEKAEEHHMHHRCDMAYYFSFSNRTTTLAILQICWQ